MKTINRWLIALVVLVAIVSLIISSSPPKQTTAQIDQPLASGIYRGTLPVVHFDVSPPLRDIPSAEPDFHAGLEIFDDMDTGLEGSFGPQDDDPIVQYVTGPNEMPTPLVSFNGPSNTFAVVPPDPIGDVGPNHVVVMSNLSFQIFTKSGSSVYGPVANNTLWAGFGGDCETDNSGDPIVLYDKFNNRWLLSQYTGSGPAYFNCIAISQTGDPTGTYYRYAVSTGVNFPDYPKYGVWSNAYYISTREFEGSTYVGVGAYALEMADLINGNPAPTIISFLVPPGATPYNIGDGLLPADLDGATLPPTPTEYFVGTMDNGGPYGAPQDALTLWEFTPDFATPANSSFVLANTLPIAPFDTIFPCSPGARDCIPQPGTSQKLDILSYRQRPLWRLAYRNFGTYETLITNQSVDVSGIAGIRWWEIRDLGVSPIVYQEGTYAPGVYHRWMGSIAMDSVGNIALAYSISSSLGIYPGIRYTGRLASDPLGTMPQGEETILVGTGAQTTSSRWGDYSSLTVDPTDDCTFWAVNEWLPANGSNWTLRIGAFKFDNCGPSVPTPTATVSPTPTKTPSPTPVKTSTPTPSIGYLPIANQPIACYSGLNEQEPNNSTQSATGPLCLNQNYLGAPDNDNWDYYSFVLSSPKTITVDVTNHPLADVTGVQVQLYYESVSIENKKGEALLPPYQITYSATPGTYYIVIYNDISKCGLVDCSVKYVLHISD